MSDRDSQSLVISRQSILLVTAVSVGLLTLTYVLGVQVGKQSAALRHPQARGAGEDLQELPASIIEQLKAMDNLDLEKTQRVTPSNEPAKPAKEVDSKDEEKPKVGSEPKAESSSNKKDVTSKDPAKKATPAKTDASKPDTKNEDSHWTVQLVSTTDGAEAERTAAKAKAAGFTTTTVKEKGAYKVRLAKSGTKTDAENAATKLKAKGLGTYPVKLD